MTRDVDASNECNSSEYITNIEEQYMVLELCYYVKAHLHIVMLYKSVVYCVVQLLAWSH